MEEIDLKELFEYFIKKIGYIILITSVVLLFGVLYSFLLKVPKYQSTTSLILATNNQQAQSTITQTEISINQNLLNTYAEIIKSKKVISQTINDLDLDYTYDKLYKNISVSAKDNTEIITVTVTDKDRYRAKEIADSVAANFEQEVVKIYKMENVSILDKSEVAKKAYNMNIVKEAVIYFLAGVVLSLLYLFIRYYFDRNIKNAQEVEAKTGLAIMGSVRDSKKDIEKNKIGDKILINEMPKSNFAEDIKTIRTNLDFSNVDGDLKRILVTSSIPGEGKSFISANLGASFAQNNKKVIIVDCDMRKGVVHKRFGIKNIGLSNLIAKNDLANLNEYINDSGIKGLDVITRGATPPNPSELLNSRIFQELLKMLEGQYDYIILDGTPVTNLPDSLIVSGMVDKVLLVASVGYTPMDLLLNTEKSLKNVGASIAGVVVNKVPVKKGGYYYSSYKYE